MILTQYATQEQSKYELTGLGFGFGWIWQ